MQYTKCVKKWCHLAELNCGHADFQVSSEEIGLFMGFFEVLRPKTGEFWWHNYGSGY
jgi:hypothetical protein